MTHFLRNLTVQIDRWLTVPEPNAAGRLGLFRILFAFFYLWSLHDFHPQMLYGIPERFRETILLNGWYLVDPPLLMLQLIGPALVAALVMLLLGLKTRLATAVVLVLGALIEAYYTSLDLESASIFLKVFIPLFILIGGDWGATYSIDALLRRRAGHLPIDPADTGQRFVLPMRAVLILLSLLFLTGAVWKSLPSSPWFRQDNVFGNLMTTRRIWAAMEGLPQNPMAELFVRFSFLDYGMRVFVVCFEGLFFLSIFNRRTRSLFVSTALIFHAINGIWMYVTFTPIMVVYGLFIDWQSLRAKASAALPGLGRMLSRGFDSIGSGVLIAMGCSLAALAGVLWHQTRLLHAAADLGGLVTWHTIWYPVLPLAAGWCCWTVIGIGRAVFNRIAANRPLRG